MCDSTIARGAETTADERHLLFTELRKAGLTGPHLEIGTAAGGTLRELMAVYPASKRSPFVVVDPLTFFLDQRKVIERNLSLEGDGPGDRRF